MGLSHPPQVATPVIAVPEAVSPAPTTVTNVTLRIDSNLFKDAARESKSHFRQLAESSGTYTGDPQKSPAQRLSSAVNAAETPDCLDRSGGASLLSIPGMIYRMAKDKCR